MFFLWMEGRTRFDRFLSDERSHPAPSPSRHCFLRNLTLHHPVFRRFFKKIHHQIHWIFEQQKTLSKSSSESHQVTCFKKKSPRLSKNKTLFRDGSSQRVLLWEFRIVESWLCHGKAHWKWNLFDAIVVATQVADLGGSILVEIWVGSGSYPPWVPNSQSAPKNGGFSNRNFLFQGSIFRGYVSFKEGMYDDG